MKFHSIISSVLRKMLDKYHRQMTPMQRLLKDLRNPLLTKQAIENLEESYLALERNWLHARMYEGRTKDLEQIDERIKDIYGR